MVDSVVERIRELDKERASLLGSAKKEILSIIEDAVAELNALGFSYAVIEGATKSDSSGNQRRNRNCPVCGIRTEPPHDARAHRGQGKKKKPFTQAELKQHGFSLAPPLQTT